MQAQCVSGLGRARTRASDPGACSPALWNGPVPLLQAGPHVTCLLTSQESRAMGVGGRRHL